MTQEQEQNKLDARRRDCLKGVAAILDKYDMAIVFEEHRANGDVVAKGVTVVPRPSKIVTAAAVQSAIDAQRRNGAH